MDAIRKHHLRFLPAAAAAVLLVPCATQISSAVAQEIDHVIHISVDGLRFDLITFLGPTNQPNFYRMRTEGAFTGPQPAWLKNGDASRVMNQQSRHHENNE